MLREFGIGFAMAGVSKSISAPLSLLQIRFQCHDDLFHYKKIDKVYLGAKDAIQKVFLNEGLKGFWKGNSWGIMNKGINNFFMLAYRDYVGERLNNNHINQQKVMHSFLSPIATLAPIFLTYPL